MKIETEAIVEKGVLKPTVPLTLPEGAKVHVTIRACSDPVDPFGDVIGICNGPSDGAAKHDRYL
jgi:predicted DNA-binding antitoxin AbrB/MazE fold protein